MASGMVGDCVTAAGNDPLARPWRADIEDLDLVVVSNHLHWSLQESTLNGLPLDQFRHDEARPTEFFEAVRSGDVRMAQRGQHLRLALEACQPFTVVSELVGQGLDG
jgi:hypothetical protein